MISSTYSSATSFIDWELLLKHVLDRMADDPLFMTKGRRVQDTTNLLIICELLGFLDPDDWMEKFCPYKYSRLDYLRCKKFIAPDVREWCAYSVPVALSYLFWSSPYLWNSELMEVYDAYTESE